MGASQGEWICHCCQKGRSAPLFIVAVSPLLSMLVVIVAVSPLLGMLVFIVAASPLLGMLVLIVAASPLLGMKVRQYRWSDVS